VHRNARVVCCGFLLFFATACWGGYAQDSAQVQQTRTASDASGGRANGESYMDHLTGKLNLTAAQKAKLQPIVDDEEQQIQAVRNDHGLGQVERRRRIANIRKMAKPQIEAILTPDRQKKFAALKEKDNDR
jgi:Spy/CpxP family protein refolding chaperone